MILPSPKDALHRGHLYKLLIEIADNHVLADSLVFKGGTCAALQGHLDRFSVDLDFDLNQGVTKAAVHAQFQTVFADLGYEIKNQSIRTLQYYLKYPAKEGERNTLKIDAVEYALAVDTVKPIYLADIDRYLVCQTIETMFAHKLVAITDRYHKHHAIAGRDIYDVYWFFLNGYGYNSNVITRRTGLSAPEYLTELVAFIQTNVTEVNINEDLNMLLPQAKFSTIRKSLKAEVLSALRSHIAST